VDVTIRAYEPRDAGDLADVFFRSVRQVALSAYTTAQVRAWAPEPRTAGWAHAEASDGRLVLVAADEDDRPVAYIDLEPDGHIDRVFCAPEAAGQGIASRLYDAVEAAARGQGIMCLFTEASELARRLFERKGFAVVERQDLMVRGVAIHNYRMAKALDLPGPLVRNPARSWPRVHLRRPLYTTGGHTPGYYASFTCAGQATVGQTPMKNCDRNPRFVMPLIQDQQNANTWIGGGEDVWVSTNGWNTSCPPKAKCVWETVYDTGAGNSVTALIMF